MEQKNSSMREPSSLESPSPSVFEDEGLVSQSAQGFGEESGANVRNNSKMKASMGKELSFNLSKVSSWALIVIFGQLIVLATAVTFFSLIQFTHTPMVQSLAEWGKGSPRSLAFCVTIVATLLSYLSAFLFSKSLILFLTSHSNRPATLINFLTISSLSRGAAFISTYHINWAVLSLLTLVILNSLTACFTTVLTPTSLIINVPIKGTEFSLQSPKFSEALRDPQVASSFPKLTKAQLNLNNQVAAVIGPISLTSAYTSASRHLGYPGMMTYLGTVFNSSTGGIVPVIPLEKTALAGNPNVVSGLNFENVKPHFRFENSNFKPSKKFPFNYTTIQEGYTVDVECQSLPQNSTPKEPGLRVEFVRNVTLPTQVTSGLWRYFFQCPNQAPANRSILLRPRGSMLLSETCRNMNFEGNTVPNSELLLLGGFGPMYSFLTPRACQFTPYITLSEVQYSNNVNASRVISKVPITSTMVPVATLVYRAIVNAMNQYASDVRNQAGDDIASLSGITSRLDQIDDQLLNGILENYFRGLIETRATLEKTPPIVIGREHLIALSIEDLSPEWTRTFEGTWSYETLGWHPSKDGNNTTILSMIPILAVTLTSIFVSLFSLRSLKRTQHLSEKPFDPNNLVTLLKAGQDASVAEFLRENEKFGELSSKNDVKIKLLRNSTQWELRPVKNGSNVRLPDVGSFSSPSKERLTKTK